MMKKILMLGAVVPLLFLAGCGEGWEMRSYNDTPYGDRTAGSGVEYVRGHMMREKGPVLKSEMSEKKAAPVKEKDAKNVDKMLNSGEKFFRDVQKK